ncbi:unnamed protein product [Gongylonema pulchrum]|uniref:Uncharacterized protein n=1 Tax=Gongylonema pulchrum TaxID=637853 RepID=A0A183CW57_9BILA|nr:unnamed protein product [Gongylonema pulchrum]
MELLDTISRLQDQITELRSKTETMEAELIESREMNDLLEFQLLENKENMAHEYESYLCPGNLSTAIVQEQHALNEKKNMQTMTDAWISENDDCAISSQLPSTLNFEEIRNRKCDFVNLRRSASLNDNERRIVQQMLTYIEHLENVLQSQLEAAHKRELELEKEKQEVRNFQTFLHKLACGEAVYPTGLTF